MENITPYEFDKGHLKCLTSLSSSLTMKFFQLRSLPYIVMVTGLHISKSIYVNICLQETNNLKIKMLQKAY